MSIFWRDCPQCGASQPVPALHCACGHCFDPEQLEGTIEELELLAREEQLYLDYLAARIEQVRATAQTMSDDQAVNPTDRYYASLAQEARETLRVAEAELGDQSKRVAAARELVATARSNGTTSVRDRATGPSAADRPRTEPQAGFRARQSQQAIHATERPAAVQPASCPRCTATLAPGTRHCRLCGSALSDTGRFRLRSPDSRYAAGHPPSRRNPAS